MKSAPKRVPKIILGNNGKNKTFPNKGTLKIHLDTAPPSLFKKKKKKKVSLYLSHFLVVILLKYLSIIKELIPS